MKKNMSNKDDFEDLINKELIEDLDEKKTWSTKI